MSDYEATTIPWSSLLPSTTEPSCQQGPSANLERRDPSSSSSSSKETSPLSILLPLESTSTSTSMEEEEEDDSEEVLYSNAHFQLSLCIHAPPPSPPESPTNESNSNTPTTTTTSSNARSNLLECHSIPGEIIITTRRILFAVQDTLQHSAFDISLSSSLIGLFAISHTQEDHYNDQEDQEEEEEHDDNETVLLEKCVYVQINLPTSHGNVSPVELYVSPTPPPSSSSSSSSIESPWESNPILQEVFQALSTTAELNPPPNDDDEDDEQYDKYGGLDTGEGFVFRSEDIEGDGMYDSLSPRQQMLDKLDSMLIISPSLEQKEDVNGQFEDAEEEEEKEKEEEDDIQDDAIL